MRVPVFLSVGGRRDTEFAKRVHLHLGEALAYHYQITGVESVEFRAEIEEKINGCHVFVVFWSEEYLASQHACRELAYFRKLVESQGANKQMIVVQCDQDGPDIQRLWTNPITNNANDYALGRWRFERAVDPEVDENHIAQLIRLKLEHLEIIFDVLIPRGWLTDLFKREIEQADYQARELVFVTGLQGHGRRTALRQFIKQAYPHRLERSISIDSIDSPEDLLISLMDVASLPVNARNLIFDDIKSEVSSTVKEIRKLLHQARINKSYYVIEIDRFAAVDAVAIPTWLSDVMSVFKTGNSPLIFIVTSSPVTDNLLIHYPSAGRVRVTGLEDREMNELVHRLAHEDPQPTRWTSEKKALVAAASGSSPSMCKSIMRSMACEQSLDFVDEIARRAEVSFGQSLASLMAHWVNFYSNKRSDLLALNVIEKLGVTSKDALDEIMEPAIQSYGAFDLYTMRDQGLVEQLSDGIYRIPPLIQRRLGNVLWGKIERTEIESLFFNFSRKTLIAKSEYGAIYASNVTVASMHAGGGNMAPEYERYVTISTLFKSGFDKYCNKQWSNANQTLQRAMSCLIEKKSVVDLTTEIEIARYAGLAAARQAAIADLDRACSFLENRFSRSKRAKSAAAMAKFLQGFKCRLGKNYKEAIEKFHEALQLLKDQHSVYRQRAAIYTELTSAYLYSQPPQYEQALNMARKAFAEKDVTHTLNALVHALTLYVYNSGKIKSLELHQEYVVEIEYCMEQLRIRSLENGQDFYSKRFIEYEKASEKFTRSTAESSAIQCEFISPDELDFL